MTRKIKFIILVFVTAFPGIAFAYIDPGTGSILIQGLIAAVAAIGVTLKLYWHRFVGLFKRSDKLQETEPSGRDDRTQ